MILKAKLITVLKRKVKSLKDSQIIEQLLNQKKLNKEKNNNNTNRKCKKKKKNLKKIVLSVNYKKKEKLETYKWVQLISDNKILKLSIKNYLMFNYFFITSIYIFF